MNPPTAQEARDVLASCIGSVSKKDFDFLFTYIDHSEKREESLDTLLSVIGLTPIAGNKQALQEAVDLAIRTLRPNKAALDEWEYYKRQNKDPEDVWIRRINAQNKVECWYLDAEGNEMWGFETCSSHEIHEMRSESGRWKRFTPEEGGES